MVGALIRQWRRRRGLSQLALSVHSGVSTRYLSTVETGKATPSRQLVLHLAEQLGVPLRERNALLVAAGYAPVYQRRDLADDEMAAARAALQQILDAHRPFPALVVDRRWDLVAANSAADVFLAGVEAELLRPPVNMMRLGLRPDGFADRIVNLPEVRSALLARLSRQAATDPDLAALYAELAGPGPVDPTPVPAPHEIALPIRIRYHDEELAIFSTVTTFGTAQDITLAELVVEMYYPADERTAELLRTLDA